MRAIGETVTKRQSSVVLALLLFLIFAYSSAWAANTTSTALSISPSLTVSAGTVLTLTATVTSGGSPVTTGLVNFCDASATYCEDEDLLGSAWVSKTGTATLRLRLGVGEHSVNALFTGTNSYGKSTSITYSIGVTGTLSSTTTINSSGSAGNYTLTGTVTGNGQPYPTGQVSFLDTSNGNLLLASPTLVNGTQSSAFSLKSSPATGSNPYGFTVGDFNGDGIPDLVVANTNSSNVTVLLGNGDGTFTLKSTLSTGSAPEWVSVADFNGDGIADLAVMNFNSNTVGIYLGNGDGTFTLKSNLAGNGPDLSFVADFNGDGIPDLAVINYYSGTISILLGNGDGTFTSKSTLPMGDLVVGDFNSDGIADLVVANYNNNWVKTYLGNGDGTFTLKATLTYSGAFSIAGGDFNGDGRMDLAIANYNTNNASILLGNGDGTFTIKSTVATGSAPWFVSVGDFNGDGFADIAVANRGSNTVSVLLGNGDGTVTLKSSPATGSFPNEVLVGDFNGDGLPDLAVLNAGSNTVSILLNQMSATASGTVTGLSVPGPGTHNVRASYAGDSNYSGSQSSTIPLTGSKINTTTTLSVSPGTTEPWGATIQLTANISPYQVGSNYTATGTVTFYDGATAIGSATISGGQASITNNTLNIGSHSITAKYGGDTNFNSNTSPVTTITVTKITLVPGISFTFTSSLNPSTYGASVTFTATIPAGATGTMQFYQNGVAMGAPVAVSSGVATYTTSTLAIGTQAITAQYSGDANYNSATSPIINQVVNKATSVLTVASSLNPSTYGNSVTFTITVAGVSGGAVPTGTVTLTLGGTTLLPATVLNSSGQATYTTSNLPAGANTLKLNYSGDTNYF